MSDIAPLFGKRNKVPCTYFQILREFKPPEGADNSNIEAHGDSDVLVVMDLSLDTDLLEQGLAREIVNR